ncbi:aminotransferase class V-fold PLP-dependent enzyme [Salisaeta longa]|uniref:aminotransferase class V-fold PLP-dependent enzyme n=1 Tax=Salisaeta longa TaxID=503170 RepID=UPI0003B4F77B|nr:aminotransferase class V-fold PLP-dependent enzyme [Salisaeta longa]
MSPTDARRYFPHTAHTIYLNHAATAPLSRPVQAAIEGFVRQRQGTAPTDPIDNYADFAPVPAAARAHLGALLGAPADDVAWMPNTSTGLALLAEHFPWTAGDRVALPACEFPANVYPFMNLERKGVAVDFIPHTHGTFTLEAIEETLTPRTRLLTLSWVQFLSGFQVDLEAVGALCAAHDIIFCVDAIQGLGALTLDVDAAQIDALAGGGQKWLMGPQGTGYFYCRPALRERLHPPAGWLHGPVDWDDFFAYDLQFYDDARQFHLGTPNNIGIAGLHAALALYRRVGPSAAERHLMARAQQLAEGLAALGFARYGTNDPAHRSGIVTIDVPEPQALHDALKADGIVASVRNGNVRFAPSWYTTAEEIDTVLDAMAHHAPSHA